MAYFDIDTGKSSLIRQIAEMDDELGTYQELGLELSYETLATILDETTNRYKAALSSNSPAPEGKYFYE